MPTKQGCREYVEAELLNSRNERRWAHGYDVIDIKAKESYCTMSAECERVFSSAKNLITDLWNGLKEDIIEACTLLRHWFKDAEAIVGVQFYFKQFNSIPKYLST